MAGLTLMGGTPGGSVRERLSTHHGIMLHQLDITVLICKKYHLIHRYKKNEDFAILTWII
jgi:hypothetical protein